MELASLQGWAVLENLSGDDWDGIELTVVSGNPVTFTQALYQAYYVDRPEVPVEVFGRVMPSVDTGAIPLPGQQPMPAPAPADFAARAPVAESAMIDRPRQHRPRRLPPHERDGGLKAIRTLCGR